ncbi:MAG: acyltransferase [Verrucomicrobiales bacterium]|nr:acyltransferase [Verrucomicrobiales bacterium]
MSTQRSHAMDHLRIVLTLLVILHHTAIAYGGSGGWYWREQPNGSQPLLLFFNAINQSHFMGFFFLLAGYFTPSSLDRKGASRFIQDRLLRLGVPLLIYFFILSPLTIALARTSRGEPFWSGWWARFTGGSFGPGPLWFAQSLLIFSAGYLAWRRLRAHRSDAGPELPRFRTLAVTAVTLGLLSFAVRLVLPVGKEVGWMQLGYFPCYVYLFAAGCAAERSKLLERITFEQARPWLWVTLAALVSLPAVILTRQGKGAFEGGWSWNAFFYALWDPFMAWGIILGSLWAAQRYWSAPSRLTSWLAQQAYPAFIIHPPVIVGLSLLAARWNEHPMLKFVVVGAGASLLSFVIGASLRRLPGAGRVL